MRRVESELLARWPETHIDPSIERISALVDLLGHPERGCPVIHLTGTNGKTSTARMIDALLQARGLRVGRYTSPHLETIRERICVDGEPLDPDSFVAAYDDVRRYVDMVDAERDIPMSFFEVLTGMAFASFADAPVDAVVLEVGLGGVWDATNVADGQVAVVTPIAIDHAALLGDSVESIAREKAGIVKHGATAVLAQQSPSAAEILMRRSADVGATVAREGLEFGVLRRDVAVSGQVVDLRGLAREYDDLFLPLFGAHQASNAACALAAVEAFLGDNDTVDAQLVHKAFAAVESPGRLEAARRSPTVLVDAAHNPAGMAATVAALGESFTFTRLVGVLAVMRDKDVEGILEQIEPVLSEVVVTRNSSPRSMPVEELAAVASGVFGSERVAVAHRLDDAIDEGVRLAEREGELSGAGVIVAGSVVTAGDARRLLRTA